MTCANGLPSCGKGEPRAKTTLLICDSCYRPSPESRRDFTKCTVCGEFFSGTTMFARHRIGDHEHLWSPEHPEGRRCLSTDEMSLRDWQLHPTKGWQEPNQVLRGRQRRTLFATRPPRSKVQRD